MTDDQTQQPSDDDEPRDEDPNGGPDTADLDSDPAYNPQDDELKDLKGG